MTHPKTAMEAWRKAQNERFYTGSDQAAASVLEAWKEEQVRELREDAERYRWLRDHSCPPHNFYISVPDEFHGVRYSPAEVDAYIDRARTLLAGERGA